MADSGGSGRRTGRRWLWVMAGLAAAGAVCAVVGVFHLPGRMYTDQAARAALQGGLLTAAAALTAVAGGLVALDETRQTNAETRRANEAADARERSANENTHVRELYVAAIGMLGAETVDMRLGGIYALERIAVDSPADQRTVVEVLSAFVREHTVPGRPGTLRRTRDRSNPAPPAGEPENGPQLDTDAQPPTDVQAALTVLGRLPARDSVPRADLAEAHLVGAELDGANLTNAWLNRVDLAGAMLLNANLTDAILSRANLANAWMKGANLTGADLDGANLTHADLSGVDLTGAQLDGADLAGARGLSAEQVVVASGDAGTQLPDGVARPASWPAYDPPPDLDDPPF